MGRGIDYICTHKYDVSDVKKLMRQLGDDFNYTISYGFDYFQCREGENELFNFPVKEGWNELDRYTPQAESSPVLNLSPISGAYHYLFQLHGMKLFDDDRSIYFYSPPLSLEVREQKMAEYMDNQYQLTDPKEDEPFNEDNVYYSTFYIGENWLYIYPANTKISNWSYLIYAIFQNDNEAKTILKKDRKEIMLVAKKLGASSVFYYMSDLRNVYKLENVHLGQWCEADQTADEVLNSIYNLPKGYFYNLHDLLTDNKLTKSIINVSEDLDFFQFSLDPEPEILEDDFRGLD